MLLGKSALEIVGLDEPGNVARINNQTKVIEEPHSIPVIALQKSQKLRPMARIKPYETPAFQRPEVPVRSDDHPKEPLCDEVKKDSVGSKDPEEQE
ncbi:MAG: hypothetical protein Q9184_006582 [Pyrenodesmia sp. 2 TL-2023]